MGGWLEKAEIKPTQPGWSWSLAELGKRKVSPAKVQVKLVLG